MDRVPIEGYEWIEWDPELAGGCPVVKGTGTSISVVLACLAESPDPNVFMTRFPNFPTKSLSEVLRFASDQLFKLRRAAIPSKLD